MAKQLEAELTYTVPLVKDVTATLRFNTPWRNRAPYKYPNVSFSGSKVVATFPRGTWDASIVIHEGIHVAYYIAYRRKFPRTAYKELFMPYGLDQYHRLDWDVFQEEVMCRAVDRWMSSFYWWAKKVGLNYKLSGMNTEDEVTWY